MRVWLDAILGAIGALVGFLVSAFMPWPRNTVVKLLPGGGTVETTMNAYQHPERVAIAIAIAIPILHGLYRQKQAARLTL